MNYRHIYLQATYQQCVILGAVGIYGGGDGCLLLLLFLPLYYLFMISGIVLHSEFGTFCTAHRNSIMMPLGKHQYALDTRYLMNCRNIYKLFVRIRRIRGSLLLVLFDTHFSWKLFENMDQGNALEFSHHSFSSERWIFFVDFISSCEPVAQKICVWIFNSQSNEVCMHALVSFNVILLWIWQITSGNAKTYMI